MNNTLWYHESTIDSHLKVWILKKIDTYSMQYQFSCKYLEWAQCILSNWCLLFPMSSRMYLPIHKMLRVTFAGVSYSSKKSSHTRLSFVTVWHSCYTIIILVSDASGTSCYGVKGLTINSDYQRSTINMQVQFSIICCPTQRQHTI